MDKKNGNLILTMKIQDKVMIRSQEGLIEITLKEIIRNQCKMSFNAPQAIKIDREKIYHNKMIEEYVK